MSARFRIDLLHPGWVAETWRDWFVGPNGWRRLAGLAVAGAGVLLLILVAGVLPTYWRLSSDLNAVPGLRQDLAARDADLALLRSNLGALTGEARRQVRWGDLLTALGRELPPAVRLQLVETARAAPPAGPGQPSGAAARMEETLRVDAVTPMRSGGAPLLDVAHFMAGVMREPSVSRRWDLQRWEIRPAPAGGEPYLGVGIVFTERPR